MQRILKRFRIKIPFSKFFIFKKSMKRFTVVTDHSKFYMPGKGGYTSGPNYDTIKNPKEYEMTPVKRPNRQQ